MSKIRNIVIGLLCILGCSNKMQHKYYFYDSPEYNKIVSEFKYSLLDAIELIAKSKTGKIFNDNLMIKHLFVRDEYYVFPDYVNWKVGPQSLSGYWVNANTGEVKYVKTEETYNLIKIAKRELKYKFWEEGITYIIYYNEIGDYAGYKQFRD